MYFKRKASNIWFTKFSLMYNSNSTVIYLPSVNLQKNDLLLLTTTILSDNLSDKGPIPISCIRFAVDNIY